MSNNGFFLGYGGGSPPPKNNRWGGRYPPPPYPTMSKTPVSTAVQDEPQEFFRRTCCGQELPPDE